MKKRLFLSLIIATLFQPALANEPTLEPMPALLVDLAKNRQFMNIPVVSARLHEPNFLAQLHHYHNPQSGSPLFRSYTPSKDGLARQAGISKITYHLDMAQVDGVTVLGSLWVEFDKPHCPSDKDIKQALNDSAMTFTEKLSQSGQLFIGTADGEGIPLEINEKSDDDTITTLTINNESTQNQNVHIILPSKSSDTCTISILSQWQLN